MTEEEKKDCICSESAIMIHPFPVLLSDIVDSSLVEYEALCGYTGKKPVKECRRRCGEMVGSWQ